MDWDWEYTWEFLPVLLEGAIVTVQATFAGTAVALLLGLVWAIIKRIQIPILSIVVGVLTDFIRGTPLLVQLYFWFFVLPDVGIQLSALTAGIVGLGVHYSTYTAEVYRAGIDNVVRGQWEAAKALNLSALQTWRYVILPQALPPMIPALANYLIAMFKETPLLIAITVVELMTAAMITAKFTYKYVEPITVVGIIFLILSTLAALGSNWLEHRFGRLHSG